MSLTIIGIARTRTDIGEVGEKQLCVRCSNLVSYRLVFLRKWFTYFFIRIYAYRREYQAECPICSYSIKLNGEEVAAAKRGELRISTKQMSE